VAAAFRFHEMFLWQLPATTLKMQCVTTAATTTTTAVVQKNLDKKVIKKRRIKSQTQPASATMGGYCGCDFGFVLDVSGGDF